MNLVVALHGGEVLHNHHGVDGGTIPIEYPHGVADEVGLLHLHCTHLEGLTRVGRFGLYY